MRHSSEENDELIEGIRDIFLETYLEEMHKVPSTPERLQRYMESLTPSEREAFEREPQDKRIQALQYVALGNAIAETIVMSYTLLEHQER